MPDPLYATLLLLAYPAYVLMMAGVLAVCGVPRRDIARWALRQADRQRLTDLIRAARDLTTRPQFEYAPERPPDAREPRSPSG